ncbi:site-specific integrase [Sulfitobacter pontiacus]|uniref:site-specific integrase n=1 Tax=Sulfitobacter pontiacus TaxID=60137 RepID=UPI0021A72CE5|nr:site-specific integrase [Sulfitobacter pontiacus]UWR17569.1 site-specific integrase [Sulfitobacter pontiacus]
MAGKIRHLINRSGRYHARLVVPKDLRSIVGKTELRSPLGADYRQALKLLPGAVAQLQHQIALAEREASQGRQKPAQARYPLAPDQIALSHYHQRLAFDDLLRNDSRYANTGIDDLYVYQLRQAVAGRCSDDELQSVIGDQLERFRAAGNIDAVHGSDEWRVIARALCSAELEALARVAERDEGDYTGTPAAPIIKDAAQAEKAPAPVSLTGLWTDYLNSRMQAGFMRDKGQRHRPVIDNLRKFLKHNDAGRVTKKDVLAWRDHLMKSLSPKTVNDIYLSALKSVLAWAVENDRLPENVAATVRQPKPRKVYGRERGYTDDEAKRVLKASRTYQSTPDEFGRVRESMQMANVKRWVPIICAFTGARVSEIIQLRKEDVTKVGEHWVARITPDAGTVKSGGYRDVPLHAQIVAEGFVEFVEHADEGPLFHNATKPEKFKGAAVVVSNKLSDWLRKGGLVPDGIQPNHAWRHRLKTQCRELGISDRVADAIQGHAGRTAADHYGDVTIKTKADAIARLPDYNIKM